jgi:uncharacterized protein (DUF58 family)
MKENQNYLSDEFIATLNKFTLRARLIVEGFKIGLHKSPYHGFSVEFSDHRQYNPGDSAAFIDWKVYAKTDRYYIKRYEEETNLKSYIILDHSASMNYGKKMTKLEYGKALASALAWLMMSQQDAVGLLTYDEEVTSYLPPRSLRSYLDEIFKNLYNLKAGRKTGTAAVLHKLAEQVRKRGLIILISDMLDDIDELFSGLQHFRHQKHEVILFHIQDIDELDFEFKRETEFVDAETKERITVNPWMIRKDYLRVYDDYTQELKKRCHEAKIEYNRITTSTPFEKNLLDYLIKRSRLY